MTTVDANRVILSGENSVIRLNKADSDAFTTNATFWRLLTSPRGPGHVLYLKSELTGAHWRIYSDNIAMTRWLQSTVLGAINAELRDLAIPVTEARFDKSGDARDFWTERLDARAELLGRLPVRLPTGLPPQPAEECSDHPRIFSTNRNMQMPRQKKRRL